MVLSKQMDLCKLALLVIDVQMGFSMRDASGDDRSTPEAEKNIGSLLGIFRNKSLPVIHIHHHSTEHGYIFTPETSGVVVQDFAKPIEDEKLYVKNVNSGFIGTNLDSDLRRMGIDTLVICGATANHCVETTTRMAGNLGYKVFYICDAVWAYGSTGPDGKYHAPEDVLSMSIANIHGEFAEVISAAEVAKLVEASAR